MNSLDRMIKKERQRKSKHLKKLFKARDMASKYIDGIMPVSEVEKWFSEFEVSTQFTSTIAKTIVDNHKRWLRPPPPPPRNTRRSLVPVPPLIVEVRKKDNA